MSRGLGELLKACWLAEGPPIHPGASEEQIRSFEARYAVLLPDDLRKYLMVVNGTGRYSGLDDRLFCFWSLEEFTTLREEYPGATCFEEPDAYFLFADHSVNLPAYAIRLSSVQSGLNPIIAVYSDNRQYSSQRVADSFAAFAEEYLAHGIVLW